MTKTQTDIKTLDMFRPFMAPDVLDWITPILTPDDLGRMFIGQGKQVDEFEKELGAFIGCRPPVLTNSCTSAITLALRLCGVGPGTLVVTSPQTCTASNLPILNLGARILWADVDQNGLIDPDSARKLCMSHRGHVKAVIAVDWGGRLCDYDYLKYCGVPIIQDAAHHVTEPRGDYCCWSFGPIKLLSTPDCGALLPPYHKEMEARLLRWYGFDRTQGDSFRCSQDITQAGYKFSPNDVTAAIGRANLRHLEGVLQSHRNNAKMLSHLIYNPRVILPPHDSASTDWWLYTLKVKSGSREDLAMHLKDKGIACSQVHRRNDELSCFREFRVNLPGLDAFASRHLCIPCGWFLSPQDVERIADAVNSWGR